MKFNFKKAAKAQEILREKLELKPMEKFPELIAGCDLTFINPYRTPTTGIGAFVVLTFPELKVVERVYEILEVKIPYVPGFLAFREIPLLVKAFSRLKNKPDAVIVDGHGIAHPRGMGIAAHFGIVTGIPSIGCAKKLLFGTFKEPCREKLCYERITSPDGRTIGFALRTKKNVKPVFISPGNLIDLESTLNLMLQIARVSKYRIPEPTRLAHNYLKEVRKKLSEGREPPL